MRKKKDESSLSPYIVRARRRRRTKWTITGVLLAVIIAIIIMQPFKASSMEESPETSSPAEVERPDDSGDPSPDPKAVAFGQMAKKFEETYRSFDWQNPGARHKALNAYGTKAWLASLKQLQQTTAYKARIEDQTVRRVVDIVDLGGDIEGTLAESWMDVTVQQFDKTSSTPITMTFTSHVNWALDPTSKKWLVVEMDPA